MTRKQRTIRHRWFRRIGWIAIFALGFQTAAPAAEAGVRAAERQYLAWQTRRAQQKPIPPDVRVLRKGEMLALKGRGRIPSLAGQAKWDIIDNGVNLRTRNYTYTATDLTLPGAIGIPVSVVRTWNANDDREGPFGIGWSWSLDVRQAAGGLIKRKAAPSRTVPVHMNNGRKLNIVKFAGLSRQETEVDGIQLQDLGGEQWIAWRDADGLYTPPPWDHNEYESSYATITYTQDGEEYMRDYALSTKVTTPDGTVYYYEAVLQPDGKPVVLDAEGNEAYTEQVLKWVEDRFGNRTTYDYELVDNVIHTYRVSGNPQTIAVRKAFVKRIINASGFVLTIHWNFENGGGYVDGVLKHPRVTSIESSDGRTVKYWYGPEGNETGAPQNWAGSVTAVENPGGVLITRYRYGSWAVRQEYCDFLSSVGISCAETYLLTDIIDADGATTTIMYNSGIEWREDPDYYYAVAVRSVTLPTRVVFEYWSSGLLLAYFDGRRCVGRPVTFSENSDEVLVVESALYPHSIWGTSSGLQRIRRYNRLWQWLVSEEWIKPDWASEAMARVWCVGTPEDPDPDQVFGAIPKFANSALKEDVRTLPILWMHEIVTGMMVGNLAFSITQYEYNCFGQPLQIRTLAQSWSRHNNQPLIDIDHTRTITYHGKEFYYQKASESETVRGQQRTILYRYFHRNDPRPSYRGQLYAVFATHLDTGNLPLSEVLEYNQFGQPTLSRALQRAGSTPAGSILKRNTTLSSTSPVR